MNKGLVVACIGAAAAYALWRVLAPGPPPQAVPGPPAAVAAPAAPADDGVVVKVCVDGTLVVQKGERYEIVRPGKLFGWAAAGPDMCAQLEKP